MNPNIFTIGSFSLRWYSVLILIGVILGIIIVKKEGKRFNINQDFLFNLAFYSIIFGILGARIYYVIFNFYLYKGDILSVFKIWEGGLAIHGGLIAGIITIIVYCKKHHQNILRILDIIVPALLLAQAIGRWGNFFNSEAHGPATTLAYLHSLHLPDFVIKGMNISGTYYIPTFFYESIACFIGFIIVMCLRRCKFVKVGMPTGFYFMYYSTVRFFIENLRTDSLMLGGFKMAQLMSVLLFIIGLILILYTTRKGKYEDLYNQISKD